MRAAASEARHDEDIEEDKPEGNVNSATEQQSAFNMTSGILGGAVPALPFCFRSLGLVLGMVVLLACAISCDLTIRLLLHCAHLTGQVNTFIPPEYKKSIWHFFLFQKYRFLLKTMLNLEQIYTLSQASARTRTLQAVRWDPWAARRCPFACGCCRRATFVPHVLRGVAKCTIIHCIRHRS